MAINKRVILNVLLYGIACPFPNLIQIITRHSNWYVNYKAGQMDRFGGICETYFNNNNNNNFRAELGHVYRT